MVHGLGMFFFQCVVLGNRGMFYFLLFFFGFFMRSSGQQDYTIKSTRKKKLCYMGSVMFLYIKYQNLEVKYGIRITPRKIILKVLSHLPT